MVTKVFSVIGPKVLRSGHPYEFSIVSSGIKNAVIVNVKLSGIDINGNYVEQNIIGVNLKSGALKNLKFNTENLRDGSYKLNVGAADRKTGETYFSNRQLTFLKKSHSVLLLTDKSIYRPGDVVNFRVFSIDSEARPSDLVGAVVTIKDSEDNDIRTYANVTFDNGMYQGSLALSQMPNLGTWTISLEDTSEEGETYRKTFEVEKYVLPVVAVNIIHPESVGIPEQKFPVTISPEYTFGGAVKGRANVKFFNSYYYSNDNQALYTKQFDIDNSSVTFEVDIQKHLNIRYGRRVAIEVSFTDDLSGKTVVATSIMQINRYSYRLEVIGDYYYQKSAMNTYTVSVRSFNSETPPPQGSKVSVSIEGYCAWRDSNCVRETFMEKQYELNSDGTVVIQFFAPPQFSYIYIRVRIPNDASSSKYIRPGSSVSIPRWRISSLTKKYENF
ncbi:CLUMA_CG003234, isoform A [Clunio marinus]|uniref:TEP1-F n=1 Tax=Clunio marinus TaxID=568069 RepID=A0A1J1HNG8_9DIPT|nr:CLUMA_CG003234, isoform A [Clunio marinus]